MMFDLANETYVNVLSRPMEYLMNGNVIVFTNGIMRDFVCVTWGKLG